MALYKIRLPSGLRLPAPASRAILDRLESAVAKGLAPVALPTHEPSDLYSLRIPVVTEGAVMASYRVAVGTQLAALVSQLVWADVLAERAPATPAAVQRSADEGLFAGRPDQARFHAALAQALGESGAIILAEGGTGLGKGRVIAALAYAHAATGVVVACPTIQILGQLLGEYEALALPDKAAAGFLLGTDQFVSAAAVAAWMATAEGESELASAAQARQWIAAGTPSVCSATAVFHRASPGIGWLAEDLAHVAPDLPLAEVRLRHHELADDDAGARAYQAVRLRAVAGLRVVFVTHAALIWDRRLKGRGQVGMLPPHPVVLIDEAHQLAGIAESAFSSQIALRTLLHGLDQPDAWRKHKEITAARDIAAALRRIMTDLNTAPMLRAVGCESVPVGPALLEALGPQLHDLRRSLASLSELRGDGSVVAAAQEALGLVRDLIEGRAAATIQFSPVRRFPSIVGGPRSIRFFFEEFWASFDRAALISATLYLPREMADPSYGLIQTTAHLPPGRIRTLPSITPAWLYDVDVHVPGDARRQDFAPPQEGDFDDAGAFDLALDTWYDRLAATLVHIDATAAGGVLMLGSSYELIDALAARLVPSLGEHLVVQARGGFRRARADFVARYRDGQRALWLATGPAWTGLDLSARTALDDPSIAPDQDRLLTDLVIARVPFGTERSSAHRARQERMQSAERDRAAFQFRQGIGRLMRTQGVRDRRLWVLDGRIWDPQKRWLFAPVRTMLKPYSRRTRDDVGA